MTGDWSPLPLSKEARLREAALLIEDVMAELDTRWVYCDHCGCKKYVDKQQSQALLELEAVVNKLRKWTVRPAIRRKTEEEEE